MEQENTSIKAIDNTTKNKNNINIKLISLIVIVVIFFIVIGLFIFYPKQNPINFDWNIKQNSLIESMNKYEYMGGSGEFNSVGFVINDIKYFNNEEVIALFWFNEDDVLEKVVYDVSNISPESVNKFINYLNKRYEVINYESFTIGDKKGISGEWKNNNTKIEYQNFGNGWHNFSITKNK